jgi:hypothetical protein
MALATTIEEFWTLFDSLLANHLLPFVSDLRVHRHRSGNMECVWLDRVELKVWVTEEADGGLCARARRTSLGRADARTHVFQWPDTDAGYTFECFMPIYLRFTIANLALDMACATRRAADSPLCFTVGIMFILYVIPGSFLKLHNSKTI